MDQRQTSSPWAQSIRSKALRTSFSWPWAYGPSPSHRPTSPLSSLSLPSPTRMEPHASDVAASSAASTSALIWPLTFPGGAGAPSRMRVRLELSKEGPEGFGLDENLVLEKREDIVENIGLDIVTVSLVWNQPSKSLYNN